MHKEIFRNTTFQIFSRVVTTAIGFLITVILARSFGAYAFGEFSKVTSFVAIFYLFVDFGINAIFLKNSKSFSSLFYLRILMSLVLLVVVNLISLIFPYNPSLDTGFSPFVRIGIFIFSFSIFSQGIIYSTSAIFQKKLKFDLFMFSQVVGETINLFLIAVLIFFAKSLELVIISFVLSNFVTAIFSLILVKEEVSGIDFNYSKKMLTDSMPIGLMMIFNLIYFRVDTIILAIYKSNQDVAIYSLSYRFFDFFISIPLFLSNSLYPKLLKNINNRTSFSKLLNNYFLVYLFISIIIMIPVWFLSPLFQLVGEDFASSITPFRILLISLPLFFVTSFLQWVLITLSKQKFLMYVYFISMVMNIVLNLIFIPKYSYIAASWVTGLGEAFVFLALTGYLIKERYFKYGK